MGLQPTADRPPYLRPVANLITLSRLPLLAVVVALFYADAATGRMTALVLLIALMVLDSIDGLVARRRGEVSLLGSVLDIAIDRIIEFTLWIVFADLDLVPIWIPLLVVTRGVLVDSLRGVLVARGIEPFKATTSRLAQLVIASRLSRSAYGVTKLAAFLLLGLVHMLLAPDPVVQLPAPWLEGMRLTALAMAVAAVLFTWVRGWPVLQEARRWAPEAVAP